MPAHRGGGTAVETPRSEDYLEEVYHQISDRGYATTSEISVALHVEPPTVSHMIRKLADRGYLEYTPYKRMKLTPSGERVARSVIKRHRVISEFLTMIGVDDQTGFTDTEGIEHHVHPTTLRRLERLAEYLRQHPTTLKAIQSFEEEG